jgi:hypothetical protein
MDIPGQSISREGFKDEVDQRFLFNVIDELRPDRIVVTSERLWSVLPNRHPDAPEGTFRVSDDSTDLFVPFTPELESELEKRRTKECFWYRRADGGFCLVGAVSHPRSSKFRREKSTAWIKSFLSIKKLP